MKSILLIPHNDDEVLFCAYTIMREKPNVIVITDSYVQQKRGLKFSAFDRRMETKRAMDLVGVPVKFSGVRDDEASNQNIREALKIIRENYNPELVYAPMVEGGNAIHDMVGEEATLVFKNVEYYSTYTKTRAYPEADIEIKPTEAERELKLEMLECYDTQKNLSSVKLYFEYAKRNSEYRSLLCSLPKTA